MDSLKTSSRRFGSRFALSAIFIALISLVTTVKAVPPDFSWVTTAAGPNTEVSYDVAVDANGNSFVTGYFNSSNVTFGAITLTNIASVENPPMDCFLAKFNTDGSVQWAKNFGSTGDDRAFAVATDPQGNCYIAGYFNSSNCSVGELTLTNATANGNPAFVLAKFDSSGNALWAKCPDTNYNSYLTGIALDTAGNVFVAGTFVGTNVISGTTIDTGNDGFSDAVLLKYDSAGAFLWARQSGGSASDFGDRVAADDAGAAYLLAQIRSTNAVFGAITLTNLSGFNDIVTAKYDSTGNVLWAKQFGGEQSETARGIAVDQLHNCYITGDYQSTNFIAGSFILTNASSFPEIFLIKLDTAGVPLWARSGNGFDFDSSWEVALDNFGNSYIGGWFQSTNLRFGAVVLTNSEASELIPAPDAFVAKFDTNGNLLWAAQPLGANEQRVFSLAVDAGANVYATGWTQGTNVLFGSHSVSNVSSFDIFITKLGSDYPPLQIVLTNNLAQISWPTNPNPLVLQFSTNLLDWSPFSGPSSVTNGRITFEAEPVGARFFRLAQ